MSSGGHMGAMRKQANQVLHFISRGRARDIRQERDGKVAFNRSAVS